MSVLRPTLKSELAAVVVWELVVVELALSFDEPQPAASTARAASSASGARKRSLFTGPPRF